MKTILLQALITLFISTFAFAAQDDYVPVLQEPQTTSTQQPLPQSESYNLNPGSQSPIQFSVGCRLVKNSTADGLFIPAQTNEELNSFLSGAPEGVTISFCP